MGLRTSNLGKGANRGLGMVLLSEREVSSYMPHGPWIQIIPLLHSAILWIQEI